MRRAVVLALGGVGLAIVARAAVFYGRTDALALALVALIGASLAFGLSELWGRLARAESLTAELSALPRPLAEGDLDRTSPALGALLRARIAGGFAPSAPHFTPHLLGLLVMLGLLGTFLGLFETLRGAREALTSSGGDVNVLRSGLAAPMLGLSRAFGTSAAGVAASATLGLAAVVVRRAEGRFAGALAAFVAGPLAPLTAAGLQLAALNTLARQGAALPRVAAALEGAVARLESLERGLLASHDSTATHLARTLGDAASSIRGDLDAATTRFAERLDAAIGRIGADFASATARIGSDVASATTRIGGEVENATTRIGSDVENAITRIGDALVRTTERLPAIVVDVMAPRVDALVEGLTAATEERLRAWDDRLATAEDAREARSLVRDEARRASDERLATRLESLLDARRAADAEAAAGLAKVTKEVAEIAAAQLAALTEGTATRLEGHAFGIATRLAQHAESTAKTVAEHAESTAKTVAGHAESTAKTVAEHAESTAKTVAGHAQATAESIVEYTHSLATRVDDRSESATAQLADVQARVGEAAELVHAGGAELTAVAEMFAAAVDRYRAGTDGFFASLADLDATAESAAREEALAVVDAYVERTREVFEETIALQRELFGELKTLRRHETARVVDVARD